MSVRFVAKLIRIRIMKLITGPHWFRVLINIGFSWFCAAPYVMLLPGLKGARAYCLCIREAEMKGG